MFASANLPPLPPRLNLRFPGMPVELALSRLVALLETSYVVVLVALLLLLLLVLVLVLYLLPPPPPPPPSPFSPSSFPSLSFSLPFLLSSSSTLSSVAASTALTVYVHVRYLIRHSSAAKFSSVHKLFALSPPPPPPSELLLPLSPEMHLKNLHD